MKRFVCALGLLMAVAGGSYAQTSVLPDRFAGWQATGPAVNVKPSDLGPKWQSWDEGAQILEESAVVKIEDRPYQKGADQLGLRLYQFKDPTRAFEFYTFAVLPGMRPLGLGKYSAIQQDDARFLVGNFVVQAGLSEHLSPESLQDAVEALKAKADPTPLPSIPSYLPNEGRIFGSEKYASGPRGFQSAARFLERTDIGELAKEVGFEHDAEAMFAHYHTVKDDAVLLLIEYPTPQLAEQHLRHMEQMMPAAARKAGTTIGRKGSLLSLLLRPSSASYGESLRNAVNYETQVTWNEPRQTMTDPPWATVLGKIIIFTMLFMVVAVVLGVAFGGVRVLTKIFLPGKVFDRPEQLDVLQLGLSGTKRINSKDFY